MNISKEKNEVIKLVDFIESEYEKIWDILCLLKTKPGNDKSYVDKLIKFQPQLARCLYSVSTKHHDISKKRKAYLRENPKVTSEVRNGKKVFDELLQALKFLISVGRGMGDAYAYFFYQKERNLLNEHLEHHKQPLMPNGKIGSMGEYGFIKNIPVFGQGFVLYHEITNILRIGDISIISLPSLELISLGELKSVQKDEETINVTLLAFGKNKKFGDELEKLEITRSDETTVENKHPDEDRVKRQVENIIDALKKDISAEGESAQKITIDFHHDAMIKAVIRSEELQDSTFQVSTKGLLIFSVSVKHKKLSELIFEKSTSGLYKQEELKTNMVKIKHPDSKMNYIEFGSVHYDKNGKLNDTPGVKPLFWTINNLQVLKSIYLWKNWIFTMYNCAFLFEILEKHGFKYEDYPATKNKQWVKRINNMVLRLDQIAYFINLIANNLMDDAVLEEYLSKIENEIGKGEIKNSVKFQIKMFQD